MAPWARTGARVLGWFALVAGGSTPLRLGLDEWCARGQVSGPVRIGVAGDAGCRGLVAERDLAPGEEALRVPRRLAFAEPDECASGTHWSGRLALRIAAGKQQGAAHEWAAYFDALPEPPLAMFRWPGEAQDQVQNRTLQSYADGLWFWRQNQWFDQLDLHPDTTVTEPEFVDALDLVCSRTLRVGGDLLLVPVLDMANHAATEQGGGYYELDGDDVCLFVGERGVKLGESVCLSYGDRPIDDFVLHYGFVPNRSSGDSVQVPDVGRVTWATSATLSEADRAACAMMLMGFPTSIAEDVELLAAVAPDDAPMRLALEYRLAKKRLLAAAAGIPPSSPETSAFA